jgi:SAM-dependent methyltransferase
MSEDTAEFCPVCRNGKPEFLCKALLYAGGEREICGCRTCGAACFFPVPEPEEIARCYPVEYFRGFFKQYWKDYYKGRALAVRLSEWKIGGELLDVGCALGSMPAGVRDNSGWRVQGLEFSPEAAEMGGRLNNVSIAASTLTAAPFPDGKFDYVNVNNVLEHEPDPAAALKTVSRLLKAGGRMELTVPNGPVDLRPNLDLYRRLGAVVKTKHGGHLFFFPRRALERMLEAAGLRVLSFRNFHFKQGFKSRGWFPGAYNKFMSSSFAPGPSSGASKGHGPAKLLPGEADRAPMNSEKLSFEEYKKLIPPAPGWPAYYAGYMFRRIFYAPGTCFGGDFKILAEKRVSP